MTLGNSIPQATLFGFARHPKGRHAAQSLNELSGAVMQIVESRASDDLVEVTGNRTDVLVDGPLIIIQNHNQPPGVVSDIVQGFVRNPACERRVAPQPPYAFIAAGLIAGDGHAERR